MQKEERYTPAPLYNSGKLEIPTSMKRKEVHTTSLMNDEKNIPDISDCQSPSKKLLFVD